MFSGPCASKRCRGMNGSKPFEILSRVPQTNRSRTYLHIIESCFWPRLCGDWTYLLTLQRNLSRIQHPLYVLLTTQHFIPQAVLLLEAGKELQQFVYWNSGARQQWGEDTSCCDPCYQTEVSTAIQLLPPSGLNGLIEDPA